MAVAIGGDETRIDQRARGVVDEDHAGLVGVVPVERHEPGVDRFLAAFASGHHVDDGRRQPWRGGHLGEAFARRDDDDPPDLGGTGQRVERPGQERPATDLGRQLVARHPSGSIDPRRPR